MMQFVDPLLCPICEPDSAPSLVSEAWLGQESVWLLLGLCTRDRGDDGVQSS